MSKQRIEALEKRVAAIEDKIGGVTYLTVQDVADALGVHCNTAYSWLRDGKLNATKVGGQWRIHPDTLEALHEQQ